jgi:hypothetical protein
MSCVYLASLTGVRLEKTRELANRRPTAANSAAIRPKLGRYISGIASFFQHYLRGSLEGRSDLSSVAVYLLRMVFPLEKAVRLLGVSISCLTSDNALDDHKQTLLE